MVLQLQADLLKWWHNATRHMLQRMLCAIKETKVHDLAFPPKSENLGGVNEEVPL